MMATRMCIREIIFSLIFPTLHRPCMLLNYFDTDENVSVQQKQAERKEFDCKIQRMIILIIKQKSDTNVDLNEVGIHTIMVEQLGMLKLEITCITESKLAMLGGGQTGHTKWTLHVVWEIVILEANLCI